MLKSIKTWLKPSKKDLSTTLAAPNVYVRSPWRDEIGDLSPTYLAELLRAAVDGDAERYLTLAEEIEEHYLHYRSVLDTRKRAVSGLKPIVEAFSDDKHDVELADQVRALVRRPGFRALLKGALDAIAKGYSVTEIVWEQKGQWIPHTHWRDPRFFRYDQDTSSELRLIDEQDMAFGIPLASNRFIVHQPQLKSGLQIRAGLARVAAFAYMCSSFTISDWMTFADVYGMPIRMGKYGTTATPDDIKVLKAAVRDIGSDAAAVFPDSMKLEFEQVANSASNVDFFKTLAEFWNQQVSKLVLGQVRTADQSSAGLATASETDKMDAVRSDIQEEDVADLCETLNRDYIIPYITLNFGEQENYPVLGLQLPDRRNVPVLVDALSKLVPLGLQVQQSEVRDLLGLADPDAGADLLQAPQAPAMQRALNRQFTPPTQTDQRLQQIVEPLVQPVLDIDATGYADFLRQLEDLELNSDELAVELAAQTTLARARGYGEGKG